jgi:hypothetical protein
MLEIKITQTLRRYIFYFHARGFTIFNLIILILIHLALLFSIYIFIVQQFLKEKLIKISFNTENAMGAVNLHLSMLVITTYN